MDIIDTHCHLNDPSFADTLPDVIERAKTASVGRFIVPAYDEESLERTAELAESYPGVLYPAYGLHPWFISDRRDPDRVRPYLRRGNAVAVGEIGLDFSSAAYPAAEKQERVLIAQQESDRGSPGTLFTGTARNRPRSGGRSGGARVCRGRLPRTQTPGVAQHFNAAGHCRPHGRQPCHLRIVKGRLTGAMPVFFGCREVLTRIIREAFTAAA